MDPRLAIQSFAGLVNLLSAGSWETDSGRVYRCGGGDLPLRRQALLMQVFCLA